MYNIDKQVRGYPCDLLIVVYTLYMCIQETAKPYTSYHHYHNITTLTMSPLSQYHHYHSQHS